MNTIMFLTEPDSLVVMNAFKIARLSLAVLSVPINQVGGLKL